MTNETDALQEIERAIDADRKALRETLGALQDELSFEGLSRRLAAWIRDHGNEWRHSAGSAARTNQVALALTGAGIGWMILGPRYDPAPRGGHHLARQPASSAIRPDPDRAPRAPQTDSRKRHRETRRSGNGTNIRHQENSMTETLKEKVWHLGSRLSEGTEDLSEEARHRVQAARRRAIRSRDAAARSVRGSSRAISRGYEAEPLPFGIAALMIGVGLAALLPRTNRENELLGQYSNELFDEAEAIYEEEKAKVKGAFSAGVKQAKSAASDVKKAAEEGFAETSAAAGKTSRASSEAASGHKGSNR